MGCYHPLTAYKTVTGGITFDIVRSLTKIGFKIPCGQCIGCKLEKSRQWAMRCVHEAKLSRVSSFITLTYEDKWLPPGGSLSKSAFQLFMKRLRKAREPETVRFYACGEYGDINFRPHYHALVFNCEFPDRKRISENGRGEPLFASEELRKIWPFGFNVIGDVTFDSAAYVARYCLKKVTGDKAEDHYCVIDGDGVVYDRQPEFALMSRRPGIGSDYYEKYGQEVRDHDTVIINGKPVQPPRFYDTRTGKVYPDLLEKLKRIRKRKEVMARSDNTPARLEVKEKIAHANVKQKGKSL